jgi:sphinganine-1-phosphate aldolase
VSDTLPPAFPDLPLSDQEILGTLRALRALDVPVAGGRTTSYVYDGGLHGLDELAAQVWSMSQHVNGLDPTAFPSFAAVENDLVTAGLSLLGSGSPDEVGTLTSGGTESCMLAVLAARERWRAAAGDHTARPTMLAPTSVHPAFLKAAHLFDVDTVRVPVDPATYRADVAATRTAIDERTALIVTSTPSYAHGVIDPVEDLAQLAGEHDVACHMDACIGGWTLPFIREAEGLPALGLMVPGVTSVSVDLHKYAYAPKGVSLILWRDHELRSQSWFATADWNGYPVVNTTLLSTRGGGVPAVAWAYLKKVGRDGYRQLALQAWRATKAMAAGIDAVPGLRIIGETGATLLAFADDGDPDGPDIRVVADEMTDRGWLLGVQPGHGGPPTAHISVQPVHEAQVEVFLSDLAAATEAARAFGRVTVDPALLAMARGIDVASMTPQMVDLILSVAGLDFDGDASVPSRRAELNAIIDQAPGPLVERLLIEVIGQILRPRS